MPYSINAGNDRQPRNPHAGVPAVNAAKSEAVSLRVVIPALFTGVGLTAEEQAQLGARFFRSPRHAATTSGSGLGLWIAKAFVGANGGRLDAVSAGADKGATVSIHLPFAAPADQPEVGPDD